MDWPTSSDLIHWLIKLTLIWVVALIVDKVASRYTKVRDWVWMVALASVSFLFIPLPTVRIPVLQAREIQNPLQTKIYELDPAFDFRNNTFLDNIAPSIWVILMLCISSAGLLVFMLQLIRSWRLTKSSEQVSDPELIAMVYEASELYSLSNAPMVVLSDQVESPCVIGVLNPTLVMPAKLIGSLSQNEIRLILSHELGHINRRDNWKLLIFSIMRSILWWHPLVWMAYSQFLKRIEEANDKSSIHSSEESASYTKLLASHLFRQQPQNGIRFFGQGNVLSRIRTLHQEKPTSDSRFSYLLLPLIVLPVIKVDLTKLKPYDLHRIGFDEVVFVSPRTGVNRLWRMKSDGSMQTPMPDAFIDAYVPSISPDGTKVAFVRGLDWDKQDIFVSNVDGTNERKVVDAPGRDYIPAWSPDGKKITFSTMTTGNWNIGIADVSTGMWRLLTKDNFRNLESAWHPNGKRIVFSSHRTHYQKLWSMNTDGTGLVQITTGKLEDTGAKYSSNGRLLLYSSYRRFKYDVWIIDLSTGTHTPLTKMNLLETTEGRFVDGETAVVCTTRVGQKPQLARVNPNGSDFEVITFADPENSWTATR